MSVLLKSSLLPFGLQAYMRNIRIKKSSQIQTILLVNLPPIYCYFNLNSNVYGVFARFVLLRVYVLGFHAEGF